MSRIDVPVLPEDGRISVNCPRLAVNSAGVDVPPGVVTVNVRTPPSAAEVIAIETGKAVAVPPERTVAVTPVPEKVTPVAPVKFRPEIVAANVVPAVP
jgi:hypothetical protein